MSCPSQVEGPLLAQRQRCRQAVSVNPSMTGGRLAVLVLIGLAMAIRIVRHCENGVLFRFGRRVGTRAPGLRFIIPFVDVLHRIPLHVVTMPIQSNESWDRVVGPMGLGALPAGRVRGCDSTRPSAFGWRIPR
ncbi:SPFH domain-containing protein [Streptomyces sp. NPDC007856]|uniref:SPFH domain-containing protein n=1 Tax=Streptomyces sp. NPDC007856 TaxID=3364781 RepID=UPI0036889E26